MPCRSDGWDMPETPKRNGMDIDQFEASLCAVFTVLEAMNDAALDQLLDKVDWKEAGVKRGHVEAWWKRHKREDEDRRKREAAEKRKDDLRKIAIGKLTPEELAILGIRL
jgi:hypothetical protein